MMRSTSSLTNWLQISEQVAESPEAFCSWKVTLSPSASVRASLKPLSRGVKCGVLDELAMPTTKVLSAETSSAGASVEAAGASVAAAGAGLPQAAV